MRRVVLGVQYDGAPWHGWQSQPSKNTVQDQLESALKKFTATDVAIVCAGRTDARVHALEQIVHFDTELERPLSSWVRGVNRYLPPSIAVRWVHVLASNAALMEEKDFFHARFSARTRTYRYLLWTDPIRFPLLVGKTGWIFNSLDIQAMQSAAAYLVGAHDFSAFRASECQAKSPIRTMQRLVLERSGPMIVFTLQANAFLHHMVRNIIGSLIWVGKGLRPPEWIQTVLESRDRRLAAPTFMPDGLYLAQIEYDEKWRLPQATLISFAF